MPSIRTASTFRVLLLALLSVSILSAPARAQQDVKEKSGTDLLLDFSHFVKIANYPVAQGVAAELLSRELKPVEFVELVESSREVERFEEAIAAAMRIPMLEPSAAAMERLFRDGKLARARSPQQIAENIRLLDEGGLRARQLAHDRLVFAGEYAMPQILEHYLARGNPSLKARLQGVMVDLGRHAVMPLAASLPHLDPDRQEAIADVLGLIEYRTSLPFLLRLYRETSVDSVRRAAERAIVRRGGDLSMDEITLLAGLAEAYYQERAELTSFGDEAFQLVWDYVPAIGLAPTPLRTEVYHEAMAMRLAETTLELRPSDTESLALWIAANYSREIDSAEGYENPLYASSRRDAKFYAVAAGAPIAQLVLARALDDRDTPLARRTVAALELSAGGATLWDGMDRKPLLEALTYQNRRVQYEAALALAKAQPMESFDSAERVVPLLAGAVRDASARFAVVLTGDDREEYDRHRAVLESDGYTVLPPAPNGLGQLASAISEAPSVDLLVTSLGAEQTRGVIERSRSTMELEVTPVLALAVGDEIESLRRVYRRDPTVMVRRVGIASSAFGSSATELVLRAAGGPITEQEAGMYAVRSLAALRDLAVSRNPVLMVSDAAGTLIGVLDRAEGGIMLGIGQVLSHTEQERAQHALFDKALELRGEDRLAMLSMVADSGKRYGNMLDSRRVRRLVELVGSSDYALATSAASVMGSLGLPNEDIIPLLMGAGEPGTAQAIRP